MPSLASDLVERLAQDAERVCRHYLSNGRRHGAYWLVGDVRNTPGRSLYVRLRGPSAGRSAAGHWTDAATGQHGDLLDLIRESQGLQSFPDVAAEARRFLNLPPTKWRAEPPDDPASRVRAARRLYAMSEPFAGSPAEAYLHGRGIRLPKPPQWLRFHPRCYYRPDHGAPLQSWPALIAAVTDLHDDITGVHRTWLDPDGFDPQRLGKAPVAWPKRAMGDLLGHAVRYGVPDDVLIAGEGLETTLSIACAAPVMPVAAALSSAHLAATRIPPTVRRLYILEDRDPAGSRAAAQLSARALQSGCVPITLRPHGADFNEDLHADGLEALRRSLAPQLHPDDRLRFLP
jgi:hypothetical protein